MASIRARLDRIKGDPAEVVDPTVVERACRECGHCWRRRTLDPATTLGMFVAQVAHGNAAIARMARLTGGEFSESAYCQARMRLPVEVVRAAFEASTARRLAGRAPSSGTWCGHRVALIDGTGVSVPDTPELRAAFGTSRQCVPGSGLPLVRALTVFDACTGMLLAMHTAPATAHDLRHAHDLHQAMAPGDVLVGDRGLCSYVHLHKLVAAGYHGLFRASESWNIPFPASPGPRPRRPYGRHRTHAPRLVRRINEDDQIIEILKPRNRTAHMSPEEFALVPAKMTVRVVRFTVNLPGVRTRRITLLTTLLDPDRYPARALAELYLTRWRIEINLRHLKRTMGMDRLRCQTVAGVIKELLVFAAVYNAVCGLRAQAARVLGVEPVRLSFIDTLRDLAAALADHLAPRRRAPLLPRLWTPRQPRFHPRAIKHNPSSFKVMSLPRRTIVEWMNRRHIEAI